MAEFKSKFDVQDKVVKKIDVVKHAAGLNEINLLRVSKVIIDSNGLEVVINGHSSYREDQLLFAHEARLYALRYLSECILRISKSNNDLSVNAEVESDQEN